LADLLRTITIKFLNPRKLGATSESWLKYDVLGVECTAAICLYFFFVRGRIGSRGCSAERLERPLRLTCDRLVGAAGISNAVVVEFSWDKAIICQI
jgi:hypothetical protein